MKSCSSTALDSITAIILFPESLTTFRIVGNKPKWLSIIGLISSKQQLILNEPERYLENFLVDARQFWLDNSGGSLFSGQWVQPDDQGVDHPFEATASFLRDKPVLLVQQIPKRYQAIQRNLQIHRESAINQNKREHSAYTDNLAKLYNSSDFLLFAEDRLVICRSTQLTVTVASIDIDQLNMINQHYGHEVGDQAIVNAANLFKKFSAKTIYWVISVVVDFSRL